MIKKWIVVVGILLLGVLFIWPSLTNAAPSPICSGSNFGACWRSWTYGNWDFLSASSSLRWQEIIYRSEYQRITTASSRIRLYINGAHLSFPLAFDSECTPDTGETCNRDGDYIGHNGNTADPSPMPARDYYNNHDESYSWYRNADWQVDTRFYGECNGCSDLGNNFLYANDRNSRPMFAVGIRGRSDRGFFFTFNNSGSVSYLGWRDNNWHTATFRRVWASWYRWFDGGNYASVSASQPNVDQRGWRIPTNLNIGNLDQVHGVWIGVNNDYVDIYYSLPDARITSLSHTSPQPMNTNITINTWESDIRGVGNVYYYGNRANDGGSSGSWWNFTGINGGGSQNHNGSGFLNCASESGFCLGRRLLIANTYDAYGNLRQQWNIETRLQTVFEWTLPNVNYTIQRELRCPLDDSPPNQPGVVNWQYYIRIVPSPGTNQIIGQNVNNFTYNLSIPINRDAYFGVLRNGILYGTETFIDPDSSPGGTVFNRVVYEQANSPDCPRPTPTPTPHPVILGFNTTCPPGYTLGANDYGLSYREGGHSVLTPLVNGASGSYAFDNSWAGRTLYLYGVDYAHGPMLTILSPLGGSGGFFVIGHMVAVLNVDQAEGPYQIEYLANMADCVSSDTPTPTATNTATATATATPTDTPTPTPTTNVVVVLQTPVITPVVFIDTEDTPLDQSSTPVAAGTPTPIPSGLAVSGFYYPLQVWLKMVPSVIVEVPASYCINSTCYDAITKPVEFTYIGMEREDGNLVATTPYSRTYNTLPYNFDSAQYLHMFWEFPHLDDGVGLIPPRYYYLNQKPGEVKFHYRVVLESRWDSTQTTTWPSSPPPPGSWPWGGPGTPYVRQDEVTLTPAEGKYLWMYLTRPVIEREN